MDFLIGSITGLLLVTLFRLFEKKRVAKLGKTAVLFFFYVVLCSFFLKPSEEFGIWLIFSLLLYSILDDMKTKTLHIYFPIITTLLFFFFLEKPYLILYSFFFFFSFLIFTKATKEKIIGEGDSYLFLPLSVLLLINLPGEHWSFVAEQWIFALLLSALLVAVIAIPLRIANRNIESIAFGPFLVIGSVLTYSEVSWVASLLSYLFLGTILLYIIWLLKIGIGCMFSYIKRKKHAKK